MPIFLIFLLLTLSSCASLFNRETPAGEAAAAAVPNGSGLAPRVTPIDAIELRLAQLWSKVDDLEAQQLQQKERSKILEKGLLLGLIPEELRAEGKSPRPKKSAPDEEPALKLQVPVAVPVPAPELSHDRTLYRKLLQDAQDKFNRANYGQAIVAFNDIGAKFDDEITEGSHHYWIGLSWFYLKEYKLAEESFMAFKGRYPSSPWTNHAGFYLAKIEQSRGLNQRALEQFQKILDDNPDRDLGEMAKAEIQRMKEQL